MIEELNAARDLLNTALDRYISACSAIRNCCTRRDTSDGVPRLERLTDCATHELRLFDSFTRKLEQAKHAMRIARDCTTNGSINTLPSETLAQIFELVLHTQPCVGEKIRDKTGTKSHSIIYPDILSHVCYRWRQVAIHSCTLWRHIDIVSNIQHSKNLIARGIDHATRAGQSLLDIHIIGMTRQHNQLDCTDILQFLDSYAKRVRSLDLVTSTVDASTGFSHSILQSCFSNSTPGNLTRLSIRHYCYYRVHFIKAAENPQTPASLGLDIPQQFIEDILRPLTILRLFGVYPCWESQAYHGLVELDLTRCDWATPKAAISGSQIASILISSPRLRLFRFSLEITDPLPSSAILPVYLGDLEDLHFPYMCYDRCEVLLQWLAPGSNPLQLSFQLSPDSNWLVPHSMNEANRPPALSKATKACLYGQLASLEQVTELLYLTPQLRVLVLQDFPDGSKFRSASYPDKNDTQTKPSCLDHLYLFNCGLDHDAFCALREMIERHSVQRLTVWRCSYGEELPEEEPDERLINDISSIFPDAKFLVWSDPNPIEDWGIRP